MISKHENRILSMLRIFRLSSFLWRIKGEEELERKHLEEMRNIDFSEVRKINDERATTLKGETRAVIDSTLYVTCWQVREHIFPCY
jgi:hypothetical protein